MKTPSNLTISADTERPLTPAQRKFNQLVRKIELVRAELLAWQEQVPLFAQGRDQRLRPLQREFVSCHKAMVHGLDALLARPGWTRAQRHTMRQALCGAAALLIEAEDTDPGLAAEIKVLYDKHADTDFDTENRESVAAMKELFESMTGVSLGDDTLETEEDLFARTEERLRAKVQEQEQGRAPAKARRPSAAAKPRPSKPRSRCARSIASWPAPCTPTAPTAMRTGSLARP